MRAIYRGDIDLASAHRDLPAQRHRPRRDSSWSSPSGIRAIRACSSTLLLQPRRARARRGDVPRPPATCTPTCSGTGVEIMASERQRHPRRADDQARRRRRAARRASTSRRCPIPVVRPVETSPGRWCYDTPARRSGCGGSTSTRDPPHGRPVASCCCAPTATSASCSRGDSRATSRPATASRSTAPAPSSASRRSTPTAARSADRDDLRSTAQRRRTASSERSSRRSRALDCFSQSRWSHSSALTSSPA